MEKDHSKSRANSDYRSRINGGGRGRGNASGSVSYADFKRNINNHAKQSGEAMSAEQRKAFGFGREVRHVEVKNTKKLHEPVDEKGYGNGENHFRADNDRNRPFKRNGGFQRGEGRFDGQRKPFCKPGEFGRKAATNDHDNSFKKKQKRPNGHTQPTYDRSHFVDYSKPMRLNRFLANAGVCSRREADEYIQAGVVSINGNIITELGSRVVPETDKVMFHDQLVSIERRVYILLNKPKDYVTTSEDVHAKKKVLDLIKGACSERVYPVGRLDRNTTGVLLITNDGELTSKLTHPSFNKKKVYQVTLDKEVSDEDVRKITSGITLEDGEIKVDEFSFIKEEDRKNVGVEIHSGRNRIVRRIFESLGYKVMRLDRVYFAGLTKKNLGRGKWRFLSEKEVIYLKMNANNPTENC